LLLHSKWEDVDCDCGTRLIRGDLVSNLRDKTFNFHVRMRNGSLAALNEILEVKLRKLIRHAYLKASSELYLYIS
jgi:hypothetical protein